MKRRSELSKRSLIMSSSVVATIQKSRQFALGPMSSTCQWQSVRLLEKINNGTDVYSGNLGNVRLDFIITYITDVTRCASAATSDVIFILCFQFMFTDVSVLQAMYCDQAQMNAFQSPSAMLYRPGSVNAWLKKRNYHVRSWQPDPLKDYKESTYSNYTTRHYMPQRRMPSCFSIHTGRENLQKVFQPAL